MGVKAKSVLVWLLAMGAALCGCAGGSPSGQARLTPRPIGWSARTCAAALPSTKTVNVLVEAYPVVVAVYLLQYRTDGPESSARSVLEGDKRDGRLAFCVTMSTTVERLAHGAPREGCPLGSFPPDGITSDTFDAFNEQFYAVDTRGVIEHVHFATPQAGHPTGCFGGKP